MTASAVPSSVSTGAEILRTPAVCMLSMDSKPFLRTSASRSSRSEGSVSPPPRTCSVIMILRCTSFWKASSTWPEPVWKRLICAPTRMDIAQ
ncbi:hypothetical protein QE432_000394 [Agrobacterium sp. SORGH_AS 745]|nr:hypothetical protein [Agrobacterium sp. SORGH_AS_0745]